MAPRIKTLQMPVRKIFAGILAAGNNKQAKKGDTNGETETVKNYPG